jgi:hypothetical protein
MGNSADGSSLVVYSLISHQVSMHRARTQRLAAALRVSELDKAEKLKKEANLWVSLVRLDVHEFRTESRTTRLPILRSSSRRAMASRGCSHFRWAKREGAHQ